MCLAALAIDQARRFPLVLATNRDEFFDRPAARLAWWTPSDGGPPVLGGRDLEAGGTWLGLTAAGRLALVTNVREGGAARDAGAPSRGRIVPEWLAGRERTDRFWMRTALSGYSRFNLIAADFAQGECFWATNDGSHPQRLERGVYGLSNAALDTPWPKVRTLKARLRDALDAEALEPLAEALFAALADPSPAADAELPDTGVPADWERALSPAFIRTADRGYGTRCSTLVITERVGRNLVTHVLERSFHADGVGALQRQAAIRHWPPRPGSETPRPAEPGAVSETEIRLDPPAQGERTISMCGMPASVNTAPRETNPARR